MPSAEASSVSMSAPLLGTVKDTNGCDIKMHDSREQGNAGSGYRGIGKNAGRGKRRTDRSISFCAPNKRRKPRRRPKTAGNHIVND